MGWGGVGWSKHGATLSNWRRRVGSLSWMPAPRVAAKCVRGANARREAATPSRAPPFSSRAVSMRPERAPLTLARSQLDHPALLSALGYPAAPCGRRAPELPPEETPGGISVTTPTAFVRAHPPAHRPPHTRAPSCGMSLKHTQPMAHRRAHARALAARRSASAMPGILPPPRARNARASAPCAPSLPVERAPHHSRPSPGAQ